MRLGMLERFHLHRGRDWNIEQMQDCRCDVQMGDDFARVTFAFSIWRDDIQRHFALLGRVPTMMSITINSMIARNQYGVTAFPPFHTERTEEHILLDRLPAILARIGTICFAGVIHHDGMEQQIIRGKPSDKERR